MRTDGRTDRTAVLEVMYPPLPRCEDRAADESIVAYQARCLIFLLSTDCTATLSDDQLNQAEVAACRACAQSGDQVVLTQISALRHTIASVLKFRAGLTIQESIATPESGRAVAGGQVAPLDPPPIVRPPSGGHAAHPIGTYPANEWHQNRAKAPEVVINF